MFVTRKNPFLTMKEVQNLCRSANLDIPEKDVNYCYAMSKMSVINESTHSSK